MITVLDGFKEMEAVFHDIAQQVSTTNYKDVLEDTELQKALVSAPDQTSDIEPGDPTSETLVPSSYQNNEDGSWPIDQESIGHGRGSHNRSGHLINDLQREPFEINEEAVDILANHIADATVNNLKEGT